MSERRERTGRLRGLHVLADDAPHRRRDPVAQSRAACAGGAAVIQLRAKQATDGEVHLGQHDLPPARVPPEARRRLLLGRSTHTAEEVAAARSEPVDYVAFGPVFATSSKDAEHPPRGLARLAAAVAASGGRPVVAIGGIDAANAAEVRAAGAAAVAVISAVADADDPVAATRTLADALRGAASP
jgi:thiamine-phosphate pyrophosphorylase